jgi:hypothetical protein
VIKTTEPKKDNPYAEKFGYKKSAERLTEEVKPTKTETKRLSFTRDQSKDEKPPMPDRYGFKKTDEQEIVVPKPRVSPRRRPAKHNDIF